MRGSRRIWIWLLGLSTLLLAGPAWSMGLLVPNQEGAGPLAIESHRVNIEVRDNLAVTHIDQVFRNSSPTQLEATFIFPVPEGATVHDFALWMNGERVQGEILESSQARQVYENIVRRVRDPGLVEYVDGRIFQASIFPVPANGTQRVEMEFAQVLDLEGELHRLVYPLRTGRTSATTLTDFTLTADIQSALPIRAVYSPSHEVDVIRESETHAVVGLEQINADLERDFVLYLSASDEDVGVTLFTFDEDGEGTEDGYFLMLISPRLEREDEVEAKDVTFVVDTSGSMAGEKMEQAQDTLRYCIGQLNDQDRFNIVRFSTTTRTLFDDLTPVDASSRAGANAFINRMRAAGGTAIEQALDTAISQTTREDRPHFVIFITDGLPTVGETQADAILAQVQAENPNARIFSFGVGYDVDTSLLDRLANNNGGMSDYVQPEEDIEVAVSNLYNRVSHPILTNLDIDFGRAQVDDVYPPEIPDLFAGNQVVLAGRFENGIRSRITLSGRAGGAERVYQFNENFALNEAADATQENDFIPQLWATRKIGFLIEQIRLNGEQPELASEVRTLGLRYGLVTPYTSYLAVDESELMPGTVPTDDFDWAPGLGSEARGRDWGGAGPEASAEPRLDISRSESGWGGGRRSREMAEAESMAAVPLADPSVTSGETAVRAAEENHRLNNIEIADRRNSVQQIGRRALQLETDGVWRQQTVSNTQRVRVNYLSDAYFELLNSEEEEVRRIMALGENVDFEMGDAIVEVRFDTGVDMLDAEMRTALGL